MDPELKSLLTENLAVAKDTNRMLRAMRRGAWISSVFQFIFWAVIVIGPIYFLAPYLSSFPSAAELQKVFNQYKLQQ